MDKAIFDNTMKTLFSFARTKGVAFFLSSLVLLFAVGCQRYAFPKVSPQKIGKIDEKGVKNKHFYIHAGSRIYNLGNPATNSTMLSGTVGPASGPIYYSPTRTEPYTQAEAGILDEVHITMDTRYDSLALGVFSAPLSDIKEVRVVKRPSPIWPIVGGVVSMGLAGLLGLIALFSAMNSGK